MILSVLIGANSDMAQEYQGHCESIISIKRGTDFKVVGNTIFMDITNEKCWLSLKKEIKLIVSKEDKVEFTFFQGIFASELSWARTSKRLIDDINTHVVPMTHFIKVFYREFYKIKTSCVLISSIMSTESASGMLSYGASKLFAEYITLGVLKELKKSKACFNILRPGIVNTKLIGSENDKINKDYSASTYSGTYTKIEDITKAILFLHSTSISGINLDLSDGLRFN